ncbi:CNH domain containing protein [Lactarius tabidus]
MAGYSRAKPPQSSPDNNADLSSLLSRPSTQNSTHWPSVNLLSPGPSVRTLNQSDGGTYHDDSSSLANFSSKDIDPSDCGSVFTANMSPSPFSSRLSTPSGSSRRQYQPLPMSLERSGEWGRSGGSTQLYPSIRADKRPYQPGLPPLVHSSQESTIGSTAFQDDSSNRSVSLLIDNVNEDLPRQSTSIHTVLVPPLQSTPNGEVEGRSKYSSEGHRPISTNDTTIGPFSRLCHICGLHIEGAFVGALGSTIKSHLQCFRSNGGHEGHESIPQVIEVTKSLLRETQPGVASAEQKVEFWRTNLVFKPGEAVDMDLLAPNRSLIHAGKLFRPPDTGFEWSGWSELLVLLFDNYCKSSGLEKDGITRYNVSRRPIPLDLLRLANFSDPPTLRGTGLLHDIFGNKGGDAQANTGLTPNAATDWRVMFPCTILHTSRLGGLFTLCAESSQARTEWKEKLEEAIGLRKVVQESNRAFEVEMLSSDTFVVPSMLTPPTNQTRNSESSFTGKVTCSTPFTSADGRALVAAGCAEGVWIGFRHDSRSMRRVLQLKMVTQCAMLEDFGIFLVLADKSLFAYHIEALVATSPQSVNTTQTPQRLNGSKDVHFFSVGCLGGRTFVIYMKKKGLDSVFSMLEPVVDKINEKAKAPAFLGSRFGLRQPRSEWFRIYRDFLLPSEAYDLVFLRTRIVILCKKGFEIMELSDFKSFTVPLRDDPRHEKLAKRCESCRPMGMFRSSANKFLLCYDEFGLYVNQHGNPSLTKDPIEWEGKAEQVAWHPPYVLIFDSRFIEVRHIETGRLCQIIPGNDLRCIWDGRGGSAPPIASAPNGAREEAPSKEARVHGVMRAGDSVQGRAGPLGVGRGIVEHIFELRPVLPPRKSPVAQIHAPIPHRPIVSNYPFVSDMSL